MVTCKTVSGKFVEIDSKKRPEGYDTKIEVSNIAFIVLYTQILKQSVLKPASPGIPLNGQHLPSPASSVGNASDLRSEGCGFESHCGQGFFILYFVASDALLAGRLVPCKWNQAWRPSDVYRCIEREKDTVKREILAQTYFSASGLEIFWCKLILAHSQFSNKYM